MFYAYERVRRWAGTNIGSLWCRQDEFSPFCTRPFIKAAFSLPIERRFAEHIHYELLNHLAPELREVAFDSEWRTQQPLLLYIQARTQGLQKHTRRCRRYLLKRKKTGKPVYKHMQTALVKGRFRLLEDIRPKAQELCLDQKDSVLWNYVDRNQFDQLLSSSTDPKERFRRHEIIFDILTLFYYETTR